MPTDYLVDLNSPDKSKTLLPRTSSQAVYDTGSGKRLDTLLSEKPGYVDVAASGNPPANTPQFKVWLKDQAGNLLKPLTTLDNIFLDDTLTTKLSDKLTPGGSFGGGLVIEMTSTFVAEYNDIIDIPINMEQYNPAVDVLSVYMNGARLVPLENYRINADIRTITLTHDLKMRTGDYIFFTAYKSIDSADIESAMDLLHTLTSKMVVYDEYDTGVPSEPVPNEVEVFSGHYIEDFMLKEDYNPYIYTAVLVKDEEIDTGVFAQNLTIPNFNYGPGAQVNFVSNRNSENVNYIMINGVAPFYQIITANLSTQVAFKKGAMISVVLSDTAAIGTSIPNMKTAFFRGGGGLYVDEILPPQPTNVQATAADTSVTVTFDDVATADANDLTGYVVILKEGTSMPANVGDGTSQYVAKGG